MVRSTQRPMGPKVGMAFSQSYSDPSCYVLLTRCGRVHTPAD